MLRIGFLVAQENDPDMRARISGRKQGLERLGWKDHPYFHIDYRFGDGKPALFEALAKELIALQPNLVIAQISASRRHHAAGGRPNSGHLRRRVGPDWARLRREPGATRRQPHWRDVLRTGHRSKASGLRCSRRSHPASRGSDFLGNPKTTSLDYFRQAAVQAAPSLGIELVLREVATAADIENAIRGFATAGNAGLIFPPD